MILSFYGIELSINFYFLGLIRHKFNKKNEKATICEVLFGFNNS
jgi:hypothetical protein